MLYYLFQLKDPKLNILGITITNNIRINIFYSTF